MVVAFVFLETTVLLGFFIHGELVLMLSGVAAARGDASLVALIVLAWAAAVAGDVVGVLLGRRLGRPFIERHGRRVRLGPERLARVDGFFERHGRKALFLGRFTGLPALDDAVRRGQRRPGGAPARCRSAPRARSSGPARSR